MTRRGIIIAFLIIGSCAHGFGQTKENLEDINKVWGKFTKAFETLDYSLMAEIHSKDLVRIAGGRSISDYQTYIDGYMRRFVRVKENGGSSDISLRFFERVNNDSTASERGVYRLISNNGLANERTDYGQFHVIFRKENGEWKILVDYDSNEGNTIGFNEYTKSEAIDIFDKFIYHE